MKYQQKSQIPKHRYSNKRAGNVKKRSVPNKRTFKICSPNAIHATVELVSYAKNIIETDKFSR